MHYPQYFEPPPPPIKKVGRWPSIQFEVEGQILQSISGPWGLKLTRNDKSAPELGLTVITPKRGLDLLSISLRLVVDLGNS
jgi:hypothetical protein